MTGTWTWLTKYFDYFTSTDIVQVLVLTIVYAIVLTYPYWLKRRWRKKNDERAVAVV